MDTEDASADERLRGWLATGRRAAEAGARELMEYRGRFRVREKAPRDLVTDADVASQRAIRRVLAEEVPEHAFVGEELGANEIPEEVRRGQRPCWIVDPLDGTTNYVHRLQSFAVSVGLYHGGRMQVGVILDPLGGECFTAIRGRGAWIDAERLGVSDCEAVESALLACSFSPAVTGESPEVARFVRALEKCRAVRRLGSAALNLCYVADGRLDGYWATSVSTWDVAAGLLIVEEAGGQVSALSGAPVDLWEPRFCCTATPALQRAVLRVLEPEVTA